MDNKDQDMDEELSYIAREGKTLLQTGLTQIIATGRSFDRARQLISDEDKYQEWVEETFGIGLYRISMNLMRLNKAFEAGEASIPVPLAASHLLSEIGNKDLQEAELRAAIGRGSETIAGKETSIDYLNAKDIEWYMVKNKELRTQVDERDQRIRQVLDQVSQLKEQLRNANKTNKQDEVDSLRKKSPTRRPRLYD